MNNPGEKWPKDMDNSQKEQNRNEHLTSLSALLIQSNIKIPLSSKD